MNICPKQQPIALSVDTRIVTRVYLHLSGHLWNTGWCRFLVNFLSSVSRCCSCLTSCIHSEPTHFFSNVDSWHCAHLHQVSLSQWHFRVQVVRQPKWRQAAAGYHNLWDNNSVDDAETNCSAAFPFRPSAPTYNHSVSSSSLLHITHSFLTSNGHSLWWWLMRKRYNCSQWSLNVLPELSLQYCSSLGNRHTEKNNIQLVHPCQDGRGWSHPFDQLTFLSSTVHVCMPKI